MEFIVPILLMMLVITFMILNRWLPTPENVQNDENLDAQLELAQSIELISIDDESTRIIRDVIYPAILFSSSASISVIKPKKRKITEGDLRESRILRNSPYVNIIQPNSTRQ